MKYYQLLKRKNICGEKVNLGCDKSVTGSVEKVDCEIKEMKYYNTFISYDIVNLHECSSYSKGDLS